MLTREKTFTTRGSSAKAKKVLNLFNPTPNKSKAQFSSIKISTNLSESLPPPIFSMPNNHKLTSGMGNKIEREQLYENNLQLRENLNKLEIKLKKSQYQNVKTEMELRKKEKIIQNFVKENSKEEVNKETIIPVKESALLTKFKQKYNKLKSDYEKLNNDYKILKANIKLTNIKEYQIENEIFNTELKKIKALYQNSKKYYNKYKDTLEKLKEIKIKFVEQHAIILNSKKQIEMCNEQIKKLNEENSEKKKNMENIMKKFEKLNIKNKILEIKNKKLLDIKKQKESQEFEQNTYKKDYEDQKKEIFELKSALNVRISEIQTLQKTCEALKQMAKKVDNTVVEPINYDNFKHFEKKSYTKDSDKTELYKSLYEESLLIISLYEKYFNEKNINHKNILKKYGFNGILNSNNKVIYNINDKIKEKEKEENVTNENMYDDFVDLDQNTDGGFSNAKTKAFSNKNRKDKKMNKDSDKENKMKEKENFYLSLFIKNLEARKITTEIMENKIEDIKNKFKDKKQIAIDEFLSPFIDMLVETMKITQEIDKQQIKQFLYEYLDYLDNNLNNFIQNLLKAFENIIEYDKAPNKEDLLNSLAFNLQKYKNDLLQKLKNEDKDNIKLISYQDFIKILSDLGDPLRIELMEFLLFKMKENTDESCSMFDLNYNIILELLEKKLPEDFEDNDSDDINNLISDKLTEFKNNMIKDNADLEQVCKDKIKTFLVNNKNLEVIEKKDFFDIMEKYKVNLNEEIKDIIYKVFIVEEPECTKNGEIPMMDFLKLKNLFLNNYYEDENN